MNTWDAMKIQAVPWAEGRRALVRYVGGDGDNSPWVEAVGLLSVGSWAVLDDEGKTDARLMWDGPGRDGAPARTLEIAMVPGQCRECYEVDTHAPDCARGQRIEVNLARGMPAFWAEWAVDRAPESEPDAPVVVFSIGPDGSLWGVYWTDDGVAEYGEELHAPPFIAIGPDGPTLAPWGIE